MLTPEGTSDGLASCWSNLEDWLFEGSAVLYHVLDVAMPYQVATRMVMTPSQLAADALDNEIARQPRLMAPLADPGPLRRLEPFSRSAWAGNQLSPQVAAERDVLISLLPEVPGTERFSWLYVDRQILQRFSISACSGRSSDLLRLWLAVMIWGYNAIDSRGPSRVRAAAGSSSLVSCLGRHANCIVSVSPELLFRMGCCKDATGSRVRQFLLYEMVLGARLGGPGRLRSSADLRRQSCGDYQEARAAMGP